MEKSIKLSSCFLRFHYWPFIVFGALGTLVMPYLAGMDNLALPQSAYVLEHFFSIVGLVVLLPLYLPDVDSEALDIIRTKKTAYLRVILTRLVIILATGMVLLLLFLLLLGWHHSKVDFLRFFLAEEANLVFLGGLSALGFVVAKHPIPGLMLPMLYYVISLFTGKKYLKHLYLFTLPDKDWGSKVLLFAVGCTMLAGSMLLALHLRHKAQ